MQMDLGMMLWYVKRLEKQLNDEAEAQRKSVAEAKAKGKKH